MMMCIGSVSDFEAQMLASVEQYSKWRSAEDLERAERSDTWLRARQYADFGWGLGLCLRRIEPPSPYSYGRRFIPKWLASERERCMGVERGELLGHSIWHDIGVIVQDDDPSVIWHWTNYT